MLKHSEGIMKIVFLMTACVSILAVILICVFLFASGVPAIKEIGFADFLFGMSWKPSQGIYGIFSVVGPTSLVLIFALSYMNVPYTTWLKYIWRFILALIVLVALVTLLVVLL